MNIFNWSGIGRGGGGEVENKTIKLQLFESVTAAGGQIMQSTFDDYAFFVITLQFMRIRWRKSFRSIRQQHAKVNEPNE